MSAYTTWSRNKSSTSLAADAPDIFADETSHVPLPCREGASGDNNNNEDVLPGYDPLPPYQAAPQESSIPVGVSQHGSRGLGQPGSSSRAAAWSKLKAPVKQFSKAVRDRLGSPVPGPLVDELCAATAAGLAKHVERLIGQGAAVDGISSASNTALGLAAEANHTAIARMLLAAGASPNMHCPHRMPPVFVAAAAGHEALATLLLEHGASVTAKDATGQPFIVRLIVGDESPPLRARGGNAGAASAASPAAVKFLLRHGADANARDGSNSGRSPIAHAVAANDVPMAAILLAFGADPNARDHPSGRPLLVQAVANQNAALVRFLLDNGASADSRDVSGASALALACERQHAGRGSGGGGGMVALLLRRGARVDSTTAAGVTVFAEAVARRRIGLARLLLEHGADAAAREASGQPVVVGLVRSRKIVLRDKLDLLGIMLERGADANARDVVTGETAVEVARKVEGGQVVKLLEAYADRA